MDAYSVVAVKKGNVCLVLARGTFKEMTELMPTIKKSEPDAKALLVDEDTYNQVVEDISLMNETLLELMN